MSERESSFDQLEKGTKVRYRTHAATIDEYTGEIVAITSTNDGIMYDVQVDHKHLDERAKQLTEFIHFDQVLEVLNQ